MQSNQPRPITDAEWKEIAAIDEVREGWGLQDLDELKVCIYGVHFDFLSGSPGYDGDLFILQGDVLTGDSPMVIIRDRATRKLCLAYDDAVEEDTTAPLAV